jgi:hypothetical protein
LKPHRPACNRCPGPFSAFARHPAQPATACLSSVASLFDKMTASIQRLSLSHLVALLRQVPLWPWPRLVCCTGRKLSTKFRSIWAVDRSSGSWSVCYLYTQASAPHLYVFCILLVSASTSMCIPIYISIQLTALNYVCAASLYACTLPVQHHRQPSSYVYCWNFSPTPATLAIFATPTIRCPPLLSKLWDLTLNPIFLICNISFVW